MKYFYVRLNRTHKIVKQSFSARLLDIVTQHSCIKLEKGLIY